MIHLIYDMRKQCQEKLMHLKKQIEVYDWVIEIYEAAKKQNTEHKNLVKFMRDHLENTVGEPKKEKTEAELKSEMLELYKKQFTSFLLGVDPAKKEDINNIMRLNAWDEMDPPEGTGV